MGRKKTDNAHLAPPSADARAVDASSAASTEVLNTPLDAEPTDVPNADAAPDPDSEPCSEPDSEPAPATEPPFPIVGIGASAGGLAAFEAFFSAIPADLQTGMAFVLVQHLAPDHKSILTELVKRYTSMEVQEVVDGVTVRPDRAYIIPPNLDMALLNGKLHLLEPKAPRGLRLPIDFFFRSLAQDLRERAIGVILSGTGSDGTLGARAIKGEGGLMMVQTPKSAAYDGMPRSAIATGLVDFELTPADMPAQLMDYVAHAFGKQARARAAARPKAEDALNKICILLRDRTSHDFSQYKQSTLERRIERRMALHRIEKQGDYVRYLQQDPTEIDALFQDLLVGVSCFFRDPDAFAVLEREVIPGLFANKPAGAPVRIWVCGCSTGEEAYSIAILLQEHLETLKKTYRVQLFATDLDRRSITRARAGVYPASIAADVSAERLARFFSQDAEGVYRIQKVVRDLLVFSEQNLIKDPPFSRLDLISCRNLLIYLKGDPQKRLIALFHYALKPGGVLFLGSSESVGDALTAFAPLNRKWKLYVRQDLSLGLAMPTLDEYVPPTPTNGLRTTAPLGRVKAGSDLRVLTERALLTHFNPVGILTNGRGEILFIHGRSGLYLEPTAGDAAMNILDMAREGLRRELTLSLQRAVARKQSVHLPGLRVKSNGDFTAVNLTVHPAPALDGSPLPDLYLVVLEALTAPAPASRAAGDAERGGDIAPQHAGRIAELESELRAKEEYLQSALEEMQTANEELKSTNEEMQSVNEELQSTNEELETSKEELQSLNEELATVNVELQDKVADLSRVNNDMNNLLAGTGIATLFVDRQLRITRFTPTATRLIKLIQSDIGRPVGDIVSNLKNYNALVEDARAVLKRLTPCEKEVQTLRGDWYLMHIGPYITLDNVIEGAVMTFMDISARKQMEQALEEARALAAGIVETVREALLVLDPALRVISANRAFYQRFQITEAETLGQPLSALDNGQWDIPALMNLLGDMQSREGGFEDYRLTREFTRIGPRALRLNARRLDLAGGQPGAILLAIDDITQRESPADAGQAPESAARAPPEERDGP